MPQRFGLLRTLGFAFGVAVVAGLVLGFFICMVLAVALGLFLFAYFLAF